MSSERRISAPSQADSTFCKTTKTHFTPANMGESDRRDARADPDDIAISVRNLGKCYHIYDTPRDRLKQFIAPRLLRIAGKPPKYFFREFWALSDISFEVKTGETIGIIGRNGSGKSTLLQIICGTLSPTRGTVATNGRIAALLELGSGFNADFTGRENVYMNAAVLGMGKEEVDARFDDIAAFADIGDFIDQPVKTYSSGMVVRLAFAVSVCIEPKILVVDEALSVGDVAFQQKCLQRLADMREMGTTILLVTHDIMLTRNYCGRVVYLNRGRVEKIGDPESVGEAYLKDIFSSQRLQRDVDQIEWRAGPGKLGFGSRQGQITSVSFNGPNCSGVFDLGETIATSVTAHVASGVANPELIVQVRDSRGYVLYGLRSFPHELERVFCGGQQKISGIIEFRADLAPGEYAVTVGLNERVGDSIVTLLDKAVAAIAFSVVGRDQRFHGCIDLHGHWRQPKENSRQDD